MAETKQDIKNKIIELKREKLRAHHSLEMLKTFRYDEDFIPSVADVETWEEYGTRWPDPNQVKKGWLFVQRNYQRLSFEDWIKFYEWLISIHLPWLIESWELELETLDNPGELTTKQKIELWIDKNIPNSPNKKSYLKVFEIIVNYPNPKKCTVSHLLSVIGREYDPEVKEDRLRQVIPGFLNDLPL